MTQLNDKEFSLNCYWITISNMLPEANLNQRLIHLNKSFNTEYSIDDIYTLLEIIEQLEHENEILHRIIDYNCNFKLENY